MIKFFKLYNGEEMIAEVDDGDDWCEKVTLHKPYRNVITQGGQMMLIPYPCDEIQVSSHHILFTGIPVEELIGAYQKTSRGISRTKKSHMKGCD